MPYYRGDYYRGDYYRGDPGILGSIGGLVGKAVKGAIGLLPGPIGTAARVVGTALTAARTPAISLPMPFGTALAPFIAPPPLRIGPGGLPSGVITQSPYGTPVSPGALERQGVGVRGFRPNKSTYVTRGGGTSRWSMGLELHPAGTVLVKSRRMNVANPRALRRSIRRAQGFAKLARRVMTFVSAKAPKGRAKFKRK